jgi:tetratricopeptide (TPR) repeat protein
LEARSLLVQAVDAGTQSDGLDDPYTLSYRHNLAYVLLALGQLDEAYATAKSCLEARSRIYAASHPAPVQTQAILGSILSEQERFAEAEKVFQDALNAMDEDFPDSTRAAIFDRYGQHLARGPDPTSAADYFQRADRIYSELYGPDARSTRDVRKRLQQSRVLNRQD